jgi:hypothetical protein
MRVLHVFVVGLSLAGCATSTVPPPSQATQGRIPREQAEYRQMAAYLNGKSGEAIKAPPDRDLSAKIQLDPTPGIQQIRRAEGNYRGEVLTSGPYSDAYVTEMNWVPITKYFKVLREVDCDTKMWVTLVNTKMVRSNPMHVSGISRDQDPSYGCEKHFHERFKAGGDPALSGADGVLIDPASFEDRGDHGPFVNQMHVFMRAWAIKFEEPTADELNWRIRKRALSAIDVLQLRAAAYWIEKHRATEFADLIRQRLPKPGTEDMLYGWDRGRLALEHTLASFGDPRDNHLWLSILREGTGAPGHDVNRPYALATPRNDFAVVAANALTCSWDPSLTDQVKYVVEKSPLLPHKLVAAEILADVGLADLVKPIADKVMGNARYLFYTVANGRRTFACPFKPTYG